MLEEAVVHDGERLGGLGIEEEDETAEEAGLDAVLVLHPGAPVIAPADDVGLHPDGVAMEALAAALHRAPLVEGALTAGFGENVDAGTRDQVAAGQLPM